MHRRTAVLVAELFKPSLYKTKLIVLLFVYRQALAHLSTFSSLGKVGNGLSTTLMMVLSLFVLQ